MGIYCQLAKFKGLAAALTVMATMTACSSGGSNPLSALDSLTGESKYAPEFIKANIHVKKSTKAQIREKFGAPTSVSDNLGNNSSEWLYDRRESGLSKLTDIAYKYTSRYGSGSSSSAIITGQNKVGDAQEIMDDAGTVTGTSSTGQKVNITKLYIEFTGDIVRDFRTY